MILLSGLIYLQGVTGGTLPPEPKCQTRSYKLDCNTCYYEVCTDGIREWDRGGRCTLANCPPPTRPYNPMNWEK